MKAAKKVLGDNMGFLERIQRVYIGVQAPKKATESVALTIRLEDVL